MSTSDHNGSANMQAPYTTPLPHSDVYDSGRDQLGHPRPADPGYIARDTDLKPATIGYIERAEKQLQMPNQPLTPEFGEVTGAPPPRDPNGPIRIEQSIQFWQLALTILMEAPVAGRIVSPIASVIATALNDAGHNPA